jgi:hypothetical protein
MSINRSMLAVMSLLTDGCQGGNRARAETSRGCETVILDDCGYETLPTSPVRRRGRPYTATDWPAGSFFPPQRRREGSALGFGAAEGKRLR